MSILRTLALGTALAVAGIGAANAQAPSSPIFDAVKARGTLVCGVTTGLAGFSLPDSQGNWTGLDVDMCRAVAAALFGDASKVKYVPTTSQQRFTALQSGEVDLLSRTTTWTFQRDVQLGFDFAATTFYDGQGFMVKKSLGVSSAKELDGATVCVQPGTTTELNLADYFRANNLKFTPVVIEQLEQVTAAFFAGRCDAYTTDASGLASTRSSQGDKAGDYVILPELISKEPLAVTIRQGDSKWADLVRWSFFAMLEAEEMGLSSKTIDGQMNSENPAIKRFVGATGDFGQLLGVDNKWAYNIIKQVGNYGEVFERNITPIGLPRGVNSLWSKGGLMYSPPLR